MLVVQCLETIINISVNILCCYNLVIKSNPINGGKYLDGYDMNIFLDSLY